MSGLAGRARSREHAGLALQQALLAIPSTAALPLLAGLDPATALLGAGAGTILLQRFTRSRVPLMLGSSWSLAWLLVEAARAHGPAHAAGCAALAAAVFALAGFGLLRVPPAALRRLLPPHVVAATVLVLGLALAAAAVQAAGGATSPATVDRLGAWGTWLLAGASLAAGAAARLAAPRRPAAAPLAAAAAVAAGTLLALPLGVVDFRSVIAAPWVGVPLVSLPSFAPELVLPSMAAGLVAAVEHVGELLAAETVMGDDILTDRTLPRAALATGCAGLASALIGGPPLAVSAESLGLAALTGRREPSPLRWAAAAMMLLAFVPKAGAALALVPRVVLGGASMLLAASLCVRAVRRLVSARVQLAEPRVALVVGLMLVLGAGGAQLSLGPAGVSGAALALVAGVGLNLLPARRGVEERGRPSPRS